MVLSSNKIATPLGNDDQTVIVGADSGIGSAFTGSKEIAVVNPKETTKTLQDGAEVNNENIIRVEMDDLTEKDRRELELELQWEMEEVMAEKRKQKLVCF
jgi:hypothetical protein